MKKLFFIMAMSVCAFMAQAQTTSGIREIGRAHV